ncbi:AraC family ethanolamine operon transcriptional activator [Ancylobacter aquaticus]|uniref:AraC family ethanolamine operon transcriptional activator n=1 Tax=Ancylobacter aquaticus TaxID=100 RepID=A0A4V2PJN1_ANCAQ|nr:helix-turn-helix domain-containing protein [Ancylobacter aquaticus]TCK28856.1 AraC family ethanolamine operon transcriptional activator [Ancylobacter aquaticus]
MREASSIDDAVSGVPPIACSTLIEHADHQAALQPWIPMECIQLGRGHILAQLDSLDLNCQQVVRERQQAAIQKFGLTPFNICTLSYCTPNPAFRFSELGAGDDKTVFFMPANTEFDLRVPAGVETNYISLDQQEFLRAARVLNPRGWEHPPTTIRQLAALQKPELREVIDLCFAVAHAASARGEAPDDAAMRHLLVQATQHLATLAQGVHPPPSRTAHLRSFHICRLARDFAEHRLEGDELPTVFDICCEVGVCERTLQYAFRDYIGMSPMAYLRLLRLNRVRAVLRVSSPRGTTVTRVAMRFGFLHLGRLAQDYRRAFGEPPSVTLAS